MALFDVDTGTRLRRYRGHEEVINSMDLSKRGEEFLLTGSDDGSIGVRDMAETCGFGLMEYSYGTREQRKLLM